MKAKWISPAAARGPGVSMSWYLWNSTVSDEIERLKARLLAERSSASNRSTSRCRGVTAATGSFIHRLAEGREREISAPRSVRNRHFQTSGDVFDEAVASVSVAYADQNEKDHAALKRAIRAGKVKASIEKAK